MPINWSSENYVKLMAALLAAHPELKPDYRNIAIYFGDGATYDAIQGCMRRIHKRARELHSEVETGVRSNVAPKPTPKKRAPGAQRSSKGKKGFMKEDVDDEEVLTPSKKKAKLIEQETSPHHIKTEGGYSARKSSKVSATAPAIIELSGSDDEAQVLSDIKIKREARPVAIKTESAANRIPYDYDSDNDYRE